MPCKDCCSSQENWVKLIFTSFFARRALVPFFNYFMAPRNICSDLPYQTQLEINRSQEKQEFIELSF
jgi:hypothetical protein